MNWHGGAFVATPGDVPLTLVPDWIDTLYVQVAWGTGPPPQPISPEWLSEARSRFQVAAWAWCQGDVEVEAEWHRECAQGYEIFVANMEEPYDAHGNSSDPRFAMPARYLEKLKWPGPLGVTTTAFFGSDMTAWVLAGAITMPQAFTLEVPAATLSACVSHMQAWGWPLSQIRPLVQSYYTGGVRPDPAALNADAASLGVGAAPYTIEQAMDPPGQEWLETMQPTITRPQPAPPPPTNGDEIDMTLIGSQHGITAMANNWRALWPQWTNPNRKQDDLSTYKGIDKLERTLLILAEDHDAQEQA